MPSLVNSKDELDSKLPVLKRYIPDEDDDDSDDEEVVCKSDNLSDDIEFQVPTIPSIPPVLPNETPAVSSGIGSMNNIVTQYPGLVEAFGSFAEGSNEEWHCGYVYRFVLSSTYCELNIL